MNGKILKSALIASALAIGAGIWYSSTVGSYDAVTNINEVQVGETDWAVTNYRGIDGSSSPLKLRGCFDFELPYAYDPTHAAAATPLVAPRWFDCFDAVQLQEDIRSGEASVLISNENEPFGFTTYIAHYPDARGYLWRQINACGKAQFEGSELPPGCPGAKAPEGEIAAMSVNGFAEVISIVGGSIRGSGSFACFETPLSQALITETYVILEEELQVPASVPACFPSSLSDDARDGAVLTLAGTQTNQYIAIYPDGRGFVWVTE